MATSMTPGDIINLVARVWAVEPASLLGRNRTRSYTVPRGVAMLLLRDLCGCTLSEIGAIFDGRDHTVARDVLARTRREISQDKGLRRMVRCVHEAATSPHARRRC
jgi:chromosomal replication initiator protein